MMANYNKFTDLELAALLKKGDQVAYTAIFERYKAILYKHAFRLLNDQDEVNDLIQDVFLSLGRKEMSSFLKPLYRLIYTARSVTGFLT